MRKGNRTLGTFNLKAKLHLPSRLDPIGLNGAAKAASKTTQGGEFLTFRLGEEEYGIDILRVQEIRSYEPPTKIANAPAYLKGVVNLRGVIVPIVDLRLKLQLPQVVYNDFTVVIILKLRGTIVGAVVDGVSDVVTLSAQSIKPAPQFESALDARFILGLAHVGERMLIVMNLEALLGNAEIGVVVG